MAGRVTDSPPGNPSLTACPWALGQVRSCTPVPRLWRVRPNYTAPSPSGTPRTVTRRRGRPQPTGCRGSGTGRFRGCPFRARRGHWSGEWHRACRPRSGRVGWPGRAVPRIRVPGRRISRTLRTAHARRRVRYRPGGRPDEDGRWWVKLDPADFAAVGGLPAAPVFDRWLLVHQRVAHGNRELLDALLLEHRFKVVRRLQLAELTL